MRIASSVIAALSALSATLIGAVTNSYYQPAMIETSFAEGGITYHYKYYAASEPGSSIAQLGTHNYAVSYYSPPAPFGFNYGGYYNSPASYYEFPSYYEISSGYQSLYGVNYYGAPASFGFNYYGAPSIQGYYGTRYHSMPLGYGGYYNSPASYYEFPSYYEISSGYQSLYGVNYYGAPASFGFNYYGAPSTQGYYGTKYHSIPSGYGGSGYYNQNYYLSRDYHQSRDYYQNHDYYQRLNAATPRVYCEMSYGSGIDSLCGELVNGQVQPLYYGRPTDSTHQGFRTSYYRL